MTGPSRAGPPPVGLSSASVYPETTATAFRLAAELGYDGVEVMVGMDPASQDLDELLRLRDHESVPVCAVHAPCLLLTQRVWGTDPWGKLRRSAEVATALGAGTVVVHPPFRWQRDYARDFAGGVATLQAETGVVFAVENMFPWRASSRAFQIYQPSWNPVDQDYTATTLDLSHTATALSDPVEMAEALGPRLHHVHLADGSGSMKDEHLVPGRGSQPCAELLALLAETAYGGWVVVELNTRRASSADERVADLVESLEFARQHLAAPRARSA